MTYRLVSSTNARLDLPPLYRLVTLRESGDAYAHACAIAAEAGAGTLVWVRRFDVAEFAVVLEPEEPLARARIMLIAGLNALADTLAVHAPPESPVTLDWPDAVRIDRALVGGVRIGWPDGADDEAVPDWLVLGVLLRTAFPAGLEPGTRPSVTALSEEGFGEVATGALVESFSRHLMVEVDGWGEQGPAFCLRRFLKRRGPTPQGEARSGIAANGDLLVEGPAGTIAEHRSLASAAARPSWLDPETRLPWL